MKKVQTGVLCGLILMMSGSVMAESTPRIIPIQEMTPEIEEHFMQGKLDGVIMEFAEGTSLPLEMVCTGDLIQLERLRAPSLLRFLKTVYAKSEGDQLWLSIDCKEWKPFQEFVTGKITVATALEEGKLVAKLETELNQR